MAREYARIRISIADDEEFEQLSIDAQWLYLRVLLPDPTLNHCGVADWRPKRLLGKAAGLTRDRIERAAGELEGASYVLFDLDTDEAMVRSYMRSDEMLRNPKMVPPLVNGYRATTSRILKAAIVTEVLRIKDDHPEFSSWEHKISAADLTELLARPALESTPYSNQYHHRGPVLESVPIGNAKAVPNGYHGPVRISNTDHPPNTNPDRCGLPIEIGADSLNLNLEPEPNHSGGYEKQPNSPGEPPGEKPPPPKSVCSKHPRGTSAACAECKQVREDAEAAAAAARLEAIEATAAERRAEQAAAFEAAADRAEAVVDCDLCDDDGYRGGMPCDHVDRTETATRGAALVRAELAKAQKATGS